MLIQEHKASDAEVRAYNALPHSKYRIHAAPAVLQHATDHTKRSAGVAIATKAAIRYDPIAAGAVGARLIMGGASPCCVGRHNHRFLVCPGLLFADRGWPG